MINRFCHAHVRLHFKYFGRSADTLLSDFKKAHFKHWWAYIYINVDTAIILLQYKGSVVVIQSLVIKYCSIKILQCNCCVKFY